MQGLTKKRPTENQVEIRFRGTRAEVVKLRRMGQAQLVKDVTEWDFDPGEVPPELAWNSGGVSIRGGRGKKGLTQKQLAGLTGIARHHIGKMENGKRPIGKETARKLAKALNIDYRVFL